jgi:hypothetical protein
MTTPLDKHVSQCLSAGFRHESRRSLLSKLTRGLFVLAGVHLPATLAAEAAQPEPQPRERPRNWEWCGLRGYVCQGNCHQHAPGNRPNMAIDGAHPMRMWVMCCQHPGSNRWRCVQYVDYCGRRGLQYGRNCDGTTPSGPLWCGGRRRDEREPFDYICTEVRVVETDFENQEACRRGCAGPDCFQRPGDGGGSQ